MHRFIQTIAVACLCGYAISGVLHIGTAEAAAPKTLCDRYLSSRDDADALGREVSPQGIKKRMELVMPACKAALKKYPKDGRIHALMARLHGVRNELALSFHHAKTSADLGYSYGAYLMGMFYVNGAGVKRDFPKSVRWWKKSAELGSPFAMDRVAKAYIYGQGVNKDPKAALKWFAKAAGAGLKRSFLSLGYMYATGVTGKPNFKYALIYYTEAKELRVRGAESQIKSLEKEAKKAGVIGEESPFNLNSDLWRYDLFARGADKDKKKQKESSFIISFRPMAYMKMKPKRELTPEGWDWYERKFVSKKKQ